MKSQMFSSKRELLDKVRFSTKIPFHTVCKIAETALAILLQHSHEKCLLNYQVLSLIRRVRDERAEIEQLQLFSRVMDTKVTRLQNELDAQGRLLDAVMAAHRKESESHQKKLEAYYRKEAEFYLKESEAYRKESEAYQKMEATLSLVKAQIAILMEQQQQQRGKP